MIPFLRIGPLLLQLPGLALLFGVWVGGTVAEKEAKHLDLDPAMINNLVFLGIIAGLIGARLTYAVQYLQAFIEAPLNLFSLNPTTLSPAGGILVALVALVIYAGKKQLSPRALLDAFAPGVALFMVFFAISHFLSGDAFGAPTELPWGIQLWEAKRHPSQVYEFLAALAIFYVIWKKSPIQAGNGANFFLMTALSALARLILEVFRGDSTLLAEGLRSAQVISLAVLLASLWLMRWVYITQLRGSREEPAKQEILPSSK
ncbi:MAG: prolipoprotein diacylglyceryl transferase [Anaerolineaceae bacterium]|nr:prolipoprotein diacylglyceryl transferase [Anaerolineaceae bacterium]